MKNKTIITISGSVLGWSYGKTKMAEANTFSCETVLLTTKIRDLFLYYIMETHSFYLSLINWTS